MSSNLPKLDARRADFGELRDAYIILGELLQEGGLVIRRGRGYAITRLSKERAMVFEKRLRGKEEALLALMLGMGEKKSLEGKEEVVLSVIARPAAQDEAYVFDICALRVKARGPVVDAMIARTDQADWQDRLRAFADWETIAGVICGADGNNQRAAIGAILALAHIGRGALPLVEMEVPQEVDESTHLVRGAEWMKAGLPRFMSASSEALWYLIRARSLHSRMFKEKKQGFYTAMALIAFTASGVPAEVSAEKTQIPIALINKLSEVREAKPLSKVDQKFIEEDVYGSKRTHLKETAVRQAAERIWRGPAIYLRGMDWRLEVSKKARVALANGEDLVLVAEALRIQRRELVRILSQAVLDAQAERDRFFAAIPKPHAFRRLMDL